MKKRNIFKQGFKRFGHRSHMDRTQWNPDKHNFIENWIEYAKNKYLTR